MDFGDRIKDLASEFESRECFELERGVWTFHTNPAAEMFPQETFLTTDRDNSKKEENK
jgi:hypothetical protein